MTSVGALVPEVSVSGPFRVRPRVARLTVGLVLASSALCALGGGAWASGAESIPPWEPDASAVGTLAFYDATGALITGGSIRDQPFASYAVASGPGEVGDTKATLLGSTPHLGQPTGMWIVGQLSASTAYPSSAAPGLLAGLSQPVVSVGAHDGNLVNLIAAQPNTQADPAYRNRYQLRMITSGPGAPTSGRYFAADIAVDPVAGTFSVIYQGVAGSAVAIRAAAQGSDAATTDSGAGDAGASASGARQALPRTGVPIRRLILLGLGLVVSGAMLRRSAQEPSRGRHCAP